MSVPEYLSVCTVAVSLVLFPSVHASAQEPDVTVVEEYGESPGDGRTTVSIQTHAGLAVPVYLLKRKKRLILKGSRLTWTELCVAPCTVDVANGRYNLGLKSDAGERDALELSVEALGEPVFVRASPPLPRRKRLGTTALWTGGAVMAAGVGVWLYGQNRDLSQVSAAGAVAFGTGAALTLAGALLRELARPTLKRMRSTEARRSALTPSTE